MESRVSTQWLSERINHPTVKIIHVTRGDLSEFEENHIPGAIGWNWKALTWDDTIRDFPSSEDFADRMARSGISAADTVIVYGLPVQYGTYAWWVLKRSGHQDVRMLDGTLTKWLAEGRPTETGPTRAARVKYPKPEFDESMRAGRDDVLAAINNPDIRILDHRSPEEYFGKRLAPPDFPDNGAERFGRIPGAVHLHFEDLLERDDSFKKIDEIAQMFSKVVPDPNTPIISYCRLSHRATLASFVMTELLGYTNVRVYDGSWTEWGSMVGMPIEN